MAKIEALRTPEVAFESVPDFEWAPSYIEDLPGSEGLRMAYVDTGPENASHTFLCLHGQPSWSFLYRDMIGVFAADGARVVAPDLFGFGRSDKPVEDAVYTFNFHRQSLIELVRALDLQRITLVVQDWGGLLGLTIPQDMPDRFERLVVMNTVLALGGGSSEGFDRWRQFHADKPDYDLARLFAQYVPGISPAAAAAYAAPFPDARYRAGVRRFPFLVMTDPDMEGVDISRKAAAWWGSDWHGDSFMAIGERDVLITPRLMGRMKEILNVKRPPLHIPDAGHFVQELHGETVARAALEAFATPLP